MRRTRFGAHEEQEVTSRLKIAQDVYDSKTKYPNRPQNRNLTELIEPWDSARLPQALDAMGVFFHGQCVPVWLDIRDEGRGEVLVNFILTERDVLGLDASTVRSKISGIRFRHIISGE